MITLVKIEYGNISVLSDVLKNAAKNADTLAHSVAYHLLTGRDGLWLAQDQESTMIVCKHPNITDEYLILPCGADIDLNFASQLCVIIKAKFGNVTVARIPVYYSAKFSENPILVEQEESHLDWRYPVTILSNTVLSDLNGKKFAKFRTKVRRAQRDKTISVIDHTDKAYKSLGTKVHDMIARWALNVSEDKNFSIEHLVSSNWHGYKMGMHNLENFHAHVFLLGDQVIGFWTSELVSNSDTANGITLSVDRTSPGVSEFIHCWMANFFLENGYKYTNINGSETSSLNDFRLKMQPYKQIDLKSYRFIG